jgi:predicted DsbA family dithiol-disulfide isomerase
MTLDIWFDYLCPQSYLLHLSLIELQKEWKEPLDIKYRSYEMLPGLTPGSEHSLFDVISKHLLIERCEVEAFFKSYPQIKDLKPYDVYDAHRMLHLAKSYDVEFEWVTRILNDYYMHSKDISDHKYLLSVAESLGMKQSRAIDVLTSDEYGNRVQSNRENAILKGIHRIPHMRIDGKHPMQGAHTKEQLIIALTHAKHKHSKFTSCEGEECEI